ncbi:MAG: cellulase family glycosylhydrolase [Bacteroidales bacterium]|nr:cellulase family glycosylhydrolase [Bacteroidales bacterium]
MRLRVFFYALAIAFFASCASPKKGNENFVKVEDGQFVLNGRTINFVGTNFWYGPIIASEGLGGNRERLHKELDTMKELGITNLRILVGSDGPEGVAYKVEPILQMEPGVYNDTLLRGLDYLLAEMAERDMHAVLYFNNSWEWSGGYGQYLEWAGNGKALLPNVDGYDKYVGHVSRFVKDEKAKELYYNHVRNIVTRKNTVTGRDYKDDPAIFSWQVGNEPRPFARDSVTKTAFYEWLCTTATMIKELDPNHMVSTGSEGLHGCEGDMALFEKIHAHKDFDYLNVHIWPLVWRWVDKDTFADSVCVAARMTEKYLTAHFPSAERVGKPIVLEEFGYPRDGNKDFKGEAVKFWDGVSISKESATTARDEYYSYVFDRLVKSCQAGEPLAGVNFWGWGGYAAQSEVNEFWKPGDDYCGDPAQEPQGLFSVYATDTTTLELIKKTNEILNK